MYMSIDHIYMVHSPCFPRFSLLVPLAPLVPLASLVPFSTYLEPS
jgi:hypothetical protein